MRVDANREIEIGGRVLACWAGAAMDPGTVTEREGNRYTVKWDDGSAPQAVPREKIAPLPAREKMRGRECAPPRPPLYFASSFSIFPSRFSRAFVRGAVAGMIPPRAEAGIFSHAGPHSGGGRRLGVSHLSCPRTCAECYVYSES